MSHYNLEISPLDNQQLVSNNSELIQQVKPITSGYTLSWKSLSYSVEERSLYGKFKSKTKILRNNTGRIEEGEILGILGPSGCGKTTLLDVLADRISSGIIEGSVYVNGHQRSEKTFRTIASYVSQDVALLGSFTVLETLRYSASLSLPGRVSNAEREHRVQSVIDEMGLRSCINTIVGTVLVKGISGGQKRRLSIAIELLSNPSILLLDEPTTGLDASSAYYVIKYLKMSLTTRGCTIICTIHQPSTDIYNMFNFIMYLSSGQTVFLGASDAAMDFFNSVGYSCPIYSNPAEYFVELINESFDNHGNIPSMIQLYQASNQYTVYLEQVEEDLKFFHPIENDGILRLKPSPWKQFYVLLHRNTVNNLRNPYIFGVRLFLYSMQCIVLGTLYFRTNSTLIEDDLVSLLFYMVGILIFMSIMVVPGFIEEKEVFYRERLNNSVHVGAYIAAKWLASIPVVFLISICTCLIVYYLSGLFGFASFFSSIFMSLIVTESLMQLVGSLASNYVIGVATGCCIYGMFMFCAGYIVRRNIIPYHWIWCHYISFHSYGYAAVMYNQFHRMDTQRSQEILILYGMDDVKIEQELIILFLYTLVLQCLHSFVVYTLHTGRR